MRDPRDSTPEACPRCLGSGWIVEEKEGRRQAVRCGCHRERMVERLLEEAGLPPRYDHCTLDSFQVQNHLQRQALARTREFVDAYPIVKCGLMFTGGCGVGKTHLAVAALRQLIRDKGVQGLFADYMDLLKRIQESYNPVSQTTEMQVLRPLQEAEVLVLDDLGGARKPTPWVFDTLFHILNGRYSRKRVTLITSNFEDIDFDSHGAEARREVKDDSLQDRIGERLRSRLYEMCDVVQVEGPDYRQRVDRG